jgi:hypothetical protein
MQDKFRRGRARGISGALPILAPHPQPRSCSRWTSKLVAGVLAGVGGGAAVGLGIGPHVRQQYREGGSERLGASRTRRVSEVRGVCEALLGKRSPV